MIRYAKSPVFHNIGARALAIMQVRSADSVSCFFFIRIIIEDVRRLCTIWFICIIYYSLSISLSLTHWILEQKKKPFHVRPLVNSRAFFFCAASDEQAGNLIIIRPHIIFIMCKLNLWLSCHDKYFVIFFFWIDNGRWRQQL